MHFDLPDLKLVPQPEWEARRREWIALAEDCLYGHAPAYTPVRAEVLKQESLWAGLARCFPIGGRKTFPAGGRSRIAHRWDWSSAFPSIPIR